MSESELRRVREDLDVMQAAAGLGLPFGWPDVWLALALAPCGALLAVWAGFGPPEYVAWGLAPVLALVPAAAAVQWVRRGRGVAAVRDQRLDTRLVLAAAVGMAGLIFWEKALGLPHLATRGAALFTLGVLFVPLALSSPGRRASVGAAVGLIPFGLALPLCPGPQGAVVGGLAMAAAGMTAAGVMAGQLRTDGSGHERAAD